MINANQLGEELKKFGFLFYSGVPCSYLQDLINYALNECEYIMAPNEGDAVAIAAGASIGGKKSVVLMQNSGLTNACSPLASLLYPFKIPVLGFVSLRGEPGKSDEPQHELMGQITTQMLDLLQVKWEYLSSNFDEVKIQLQHANSYIESNRSFFFVVKKGSFTKECLLVQKPQKTKESNLHPKRTVDQAPTRFEALKVINSLKNNQTIQLATTGKTGRELYEIEDASNNLYMVGSMGCVNSLGLGLSLVRKEKDIVVIDGDGALLMRMGNLATNGTYSPPNMLHILLDNNTYDSTGGQSTVSQNVHFVNIAASCGYVNATYVHNLEELKTCIESWKKNKGLTFLYLKIEKGSKKELGRPKIKPFEVKERLQVFLHD